MLVIDLPGGALDASNSGHLTYLVTANGKTFPSNGFGNWVRKACDKVRLSTCTGHGIRKAAATIAAENGATAPQIQAIGGWDTLAEAERYTRKADKRKLVAGAIAKIDPLFDPMASGGSKPSHKALK